MSDAAAVKLSIRGEEFQGPLLDEAGTGEWLERLAERPGVTVQDIGRSREGRPLHSVLIGSGPQSCSITAGAHADEPAGPLAAAALAWWLSSPSAEAADLCQEATFLIFPQVNPDGAEANRDWFAPIPDILKYLFHVKRELPGDDVEFGYPDGSGRPVRPENAEVADALAAHAAHRGPFSFHASLHSMGFAEGAWFLIDRHWTDRTAILQANLAAVANRAGFTLHDIDRRGDKGFTRIARGFCTTPRSDAMRQHFLDAGDPAMADRFRLNSMEYVRSLGGDPLAMVTEIPNFALGGGWQSDPRPLQKIHTPAPEPGSTLYEKARAELKDAGGDPARLAELAARYQVVPVPFAAQVHVMVETVLEGVATAAGHR